MYDGRGDDEAGGEPPFLGFLEQGFAGKGVLSQPDGAVEGLSPAGEGSGTSSRICHELVRGVRFVESQDRQASDVELVEIGIEGRADLCQPQPVADHEDDVDRLVPGYRLSVRGADLRPAVQAPTETEKKESIFGQYLHVANRILLWGIIALTQLGSNIKKK